MNNADKNIFESIKDGVHRSHVQDCRLRLFAKSGAKGGLHLSSIFGLILVEISVLCRFLQLVVCEDRDLNTPVLLPAGGC